MHWDLWHRTAADQADRKRWEELDLVDTDRGHTRPAGETVGEVVRPGIDLVVVAHIDYIDRIAYFPRVSCVCL